MLLILVDVAMPNKLNSLQKRNRTRIVMENFIE